MQVVLTPEGTLRLDEPGVFNEFEVRLPTGSVPLPGCVVQEGEQHAWVEEVWLRAALERAELPAGWQPSYEAMLAYADRKGWARGNPCAIRAHIRRAPSGAGSISAASGPACR